MTTCPLCKKPTDPKYKPFCSKRCADIDLGKWLGEAYTIPTYEAPNDDDAKDPTENN